MERIEVLHSPTHSGGKHKDYRQQQQQQQQQHYADDDDDDHHEGYETHDEHETDRVDDSLIADEHNDHFLYIASLNKSKNARRQYVCVGAVVLVCVLAALLGTWVGTSIRNDPVKTSGSPTSTDGNGNDNDNSGGSPTGSPPPGKSPTVDVPIDENAAGYRDILLAVARNGGAEFDDPLSYQSRALAWIQTLRLPSGQKLTLEQETVQLYAVACLYYSTYSVPNPYTDQRYGPGQPVPGWSADVGWLDHPSTVCYWFGIQCDAQGRVESIQLHENGLTGRFPPEVALLSDSLKHIELFDNDVYNYGDAGNSFLGELTNLEKLFYGSTRFGHPGGIPTELARLSKLQQLDISRTQYAGPLRGDVFQQMDQLVYMALSGNAYDSPVPTQIVALPNLEFLFVVDSKLTGNLDFIADMPIVREVWIDNNPGLAGSTIPTDIDRAKELASFSATECGLVGPIPSAIGTLSNMKQIWLYDNKLAGNIPTELGDLSRLETLQLEGNLLVGSMPEQICTLRASNAAFASLEADCPDKVSCPESCCTCCGVECATPGN